MDVLYNSQAAANQNSVVCSYSKHAEYHSSGSNVLPIPSSLGVSVLISFSCGSFVAEDSLNTFDIKSYLMSS